MIVIMSKFAATEFLANQEIIVHPPVLHGVVLRHYVPPGRLTLATTDSLVAFFANDGDPDAGRHLAERCRHQ